MESRISLKSVLIAVIFFATTLAMHEAARAEGGQGHYPNGWNNAWSNAWHSVGRLRHKAARDSEQIF